MRFAERPRTPLTSLLLRRPNSNENQAVQTKKNSICPSGVCELFREIETKTSPSWGKYGRNRQHTPPFLWNILTHVVRLLFYSTNCQYPTSSRITKLLGEERFEIQRSLGVESRPGCKNQRGVEEGRGVLFGILTK